MRIKTLGLFFLVMVTAALASGQALTRCGGPNNALYINWPASGFDACHTGYNPYEYRINSANVQDLVVAWEYGPGTGPFNSPVLVNDVVYFGGDNVYAVDSGTGALLWTYNTGSKVQTYSAVFNNVLYVGSGRSVYALDAKAGTLLWKYDTSAPIYTGATVADGLVYIGSNDGGGYIIYALDAKTGALRWQRTPGNTGTPTVVNGLVYFGSSDGDLYALNAVSGAVVWHASLAGGVNDAVVVVGNVVYVSTNNDLHALNALTGAFLWITTGEFTSSPVVGAGAVYVGAAASRVSPGPLVYSFNATNGSLLWSWPEGGGYGTIDALALANGVLYAVDFYDGLVAFSSADGSFLWESPNAPGGSPIIANGTVYIPDGDSSYLYAFRLPNQ